MDYDELEDISEKVSVHWQERMGEKVYPFVSPVLEGSIIPSLKARALAENWTGEQFHVASIRAIGLTADLFGALHNNAHSDIAPQNERPRFYWVHQKFDFLRANDAKRGIDIYKDEMLRIAAEYLSHPEIRSNKFDWLLMDAIVFAELDAFAYHTISSQWGTGMASAIADGSYPKYFAILASFKLLSVAFSYVVPLVIAYYALSKGHELTGWSVAGLWALGLVWSLIGLPFRWKAGRKAKELLSRMNDVYQLLGDSTISPRLLKDALDKAAAAGVAVDGAVFSIVDRMIARDATAFVPGQIG